MDQSGGRQLTVLGDEYDDNLREALRATLIELGGRLTDQSWVPDFEQLEVDIQGQTITVESETYVGLSVSGEPNLVQRIAARVRERIAGAL